MVNVDRLLGFKGGVRDLFLDFATGDEITLLFGERDLLARLFFLDKFGVGIVDTFVNCEEFFISPPVIFCTMTGVLLFLRLHSSSEILHTDAFLLFFLELVIAISVGVLNVSSFTPCVLSVLSFRQIGVKSRSDSPVNLTALLQVVSDMSEVSEISLWMGVLVDTADSLLTLPITGVFSNRSFLLNTV